MNTHKGWGICQVAISGGQLPRIVLMRTSENPQNANFALKLSEKSHWRAKRLTIRRLIAT